MAVAIPFIAIAAAAAGTYMSYAGQKTCPRCGWDMAEMPPRDPPLWLSAWVCECGYCEVVTMPVIGKIKVNIEVKP